MSVFLMLLEIDNIPLDEGFKSVDNADVNYQDIIYISTGIG
jgi:hypothetical protein